MSSGGRELVFNTQERAVSTDNNRAQKFIRRDLAEMLRFMLNVSGNDDLDAGAVAVEHLNVESPLRAEIINGLLVRPSPGSLSLLVDTGVLYAIQPDGGPDDSRYKFIQDNGITTGGILTMTVGGAAVRIDVVECQIDTTVGIDVVEADNRDIFNPSTGLFSATSVTKARQSKLTYRVRAGADGGGFPGTAVGWLPLAVVSVPAASLTADDRTFWDVRPLLNDREFQPFALTSQNTKIETGIITHDTFTVAGETRVFGLTEAISQDGRRLGGRLRMGVPGEVAGDWVDINDPINHSAGLALPAATLMYLYLVTPFGLPRWARYTIGPVGRLPRSPRGIPVLSDVHANNLGVPLAPIALPTSTGLLGSTQDGVNIGITATTIAGGVVQGFSCDGYTTWVGGHNLPHDAFIIVGSTSFTPTGDASWTLNDAALPPNARAMWCRFRFTFTVVTLFSGNLYTTDGAALQWAGSDYVYGISNPIVGNPQPGTITVYHTTEMMRVPIPTTYPQSFLPGLHILGKSATLTVGAVQTAAAEIDIFGWEIGP